LNEENLPRFNMPLELGLFLGAKKFGNPSQRLKKCLILDREPHRYQKFLSDIAGQDIRSHDDEEQELVRQVRDWLNDLELARPLPSGGLIFDEYQDFLVDLPNICEALDLLLNELTFRDFARVTFEWFKIREQQIDAS
jgi:hypothetical protein